MTASLSIEELIAGHAAGRLPEPVAMVVATHLSLSPTNRRIYEGFNEVGGALLEGVEPSPMSRSSYDRISALLDDEYLCEDRAKRSLRRWPAPLANYVADYLPEDKWRHFGSGSEYEIKTGSPDFRVRLIRVKAGRAVPQHTHRGFEVTVVLEGAYRDQFGRFGPGDIEIADGEIDHQPVAESERDCYCLAVTDAPLRLTGRFSRFLNPFIKM